MLKKMFFFFSQFRNTSRRKKNDFTTANAPDTRRKQTRTANIAPIPKRNSQIPQNKPNDAF